MRFPLVVLLLAAAALMAGCGDDDDQSGGDGPVIEHVHGLGVNPGDSALYIATHHGLFRLPKGSESPETVGETRHDFMGFGIVGADRFIASGHPAPGDDAPPHLGLIESTDAGRSWSTVSLAGEADFHVLRSAGRRLYGYDSSGGRFMVSSDGGREWDERETPGAVIDVAVDPSDDERLIAATETGLHTSNNAGRSWRRADRDRIGLLAWSAADRLYLVDAEGTVHLSRNRGERWSELGSIEGPPAAFAAGEGGDLYAARPDAAVLRSTDGAKTWTVLLAPSGSEATPAPSGE